MIVKENGNQLILIPDGFEFFLQLSFKVGGYTLVLVFILIAAAQEGIFVLILLILAGWLLLAVFTEEKAYTTIFDKDLQTIQTTLHSPWTFFISQKKVFQFKNLVSIILSRSDEDNQVLYLKFKGNSQICFAGTATVECAEKISMFMKIPLIIEVGQEHITHMPWASNKEGTPFPTPCAKCGAPLPLIEAGMMNVKCSHCGMTMVISWSEGMISYKAKSS